MVVKVAKASSSNLLWSNEEERDFQNECVCLCEREREREKRERERERERF